MRMCDSLKASAMKHAEAATNIRKEFYMKTRCNVLFGLLLAASVYGERMTVGVIRWDAWFDWSKYSKVSNRYEGYLTPKQWHERLPFYAKVLSNTVVEIRGDTQDIVDREIEYAAKAGVDYWVFDWYHPKSFVMADGFNYAFNYYRTSEKKKLLKYCYLLQSQWLGPKDEWEMTVAGFVSNFQDMQYQKVSGGRPIVYINYLDEMPKSVDSWKGGKRGFGSWEEARKSLDYLRKRTTDAGLANPYLVGNIYYSTWHIKNIDELGLDAVSAYSANSMKAPADGDGRELPYRELMKINEERWELYKSTGKKVIPPLNTGWDFRAMLVDEKEKASSSYKGPWFTKPTPEELTEHVRSAMQWVARNPDAAEANTILVYAWDELCEGSWVLVPTLAEGTTRLDALAKALTGR